MIHRLRRNFYCVLTVVGWTILFQPTSLLPYLQTPSEVLSKKIGIPESTGQIITQCALVPTTAAAFFTEKYTQHVFKHNMNTIENRALVAGLWAASLALCMGCGAYYAASLYYEDTIAHPSFFNLLDTDEEGTIIRNTLPDYIINPAPETPEQEKITQKRHISRFIWRLTKRIIVTGACCIALFKAYYYARSIYQNDIPQQYQYKNRPFENEQEDSNPKIDPEQLESYQ